MAVVARATNGGEGHEKATEKGGLRRETRGTESEKERKLATKATDGEGARGEKRVG